MPGVVGFETRCQVCGMTNIKAGVSGAIPQDVNVVEV